MFKLKMMIGIQVILYASFLFAENKKVTFIYDNSPPYYITEGPFKGQGTGDLLFKQIKDHTPIYAFEFVEGSSLRMREVFKNKTGIFCSFLSGVLEEDNIIYSIPTAILKLNQGYYFTKDKSKFFSQEKDKFFLLEEVPDGVKFGIHQGYTHIIPDLENKKHKINFMASGESLHKMLFAKRFDYILSSAEEMNYYHQFLNTSLENFRSKVYRSPRNPKSTRLIRKVFTEKGLQRCALTYMLCNPTEDSKAFTRDINQVLLNIRKNKEYKDAVFRWIPEDLKEDLEKIYLSFIVSKNLPGDYVEFE